MGCGGDIVDNPVVIHLVGADKSRNVRVVHDEHESLIDRLFGVILLLVHVPADALTNHVSECAHVRSGPWGDVVFGLDAAHDPDVRLVPVRWGAPAFARSASMYAVQHCRGMFGVGERVPSRLRP